MLSLKPAGWLALLAACGSVSSPEEIDEGDEALIASFDPVEASEACLAKHSPAECMVRGIDRHFEGAACGEEPLLLEDPRRTCLTEAYDAAPADTVRCMAQSQWKLAACSTDASCSLPAIQLCVDAQIARTEACPAPPASLAEGLSACSEISNAQP